MNIVITGASKGVGFEVVKLLARHKQNQIVAISRNGKALKELVAECTRQYPDSKVIPYEFDVSQFDFYPFIVQRIETFIHKCDVLINNAGKLVNKPFDQFEQADFDDIFNVNIKAPFFLTQAMLPIMTKGAHIVNIGSQGGITGSAKYPGLSAYTSSKGALAMLSELLAEEFSEREIRVNCLALGAVQTEMFAKAFPGARALQTPVQVAQFIADFAVSGHKYFNGKVLPVSVSVP
jgi:NAD(P)-dependent dehydrogenase (short-subunit alcohol dehydrogenase family)